MMGCCHSSSGRTCNVINTTGLDLIVEMHYRDVDADAMTGPRILVSSWNSALIAIGGFYNPDSLECMRIYCNDTLMGAFTPVRKFDVWDCWFQYYARWPASIGITASLDCLNVVGHDIDMRMIYFSEASVRILHDYALDRKHH